MAPMWICPYFKDNKENWRGRRKSDDTPTRRLAKEKKILEEDKWSEGQPPFIAMKKHYNKIKKSLRTIVSWTLKKKKSLAEQT